MHHGEAAQNRPVSHMDVARQLGIVGEDGVITDDAIVRKVHIGHQPVVIADAGYTHIPWRANVKGAKLANGVAVANDQFTGFSGVLLVLRNSTQRAELENAVVASDRGVSFNHAMRTNRGPRAHLDVGANQAVGANGHRAVQLGLGIDNRRGMDGGQSADLRRAAPRRPSPPGGQCSGEAANVGALIFQAILRTAQVNSASTASSSSTRARALNLKMPAFMRNNSTSRIS